MTSIRSRATRQARHATADAPSHGPLTSTRLRADDGSRIGELACAEPP